MLQHTIEMTPNIAHLILVHHNPPHLVRLISRLRHRQVRIFVHVDKKADIHTFESLFKHQQDVYFLKKRVAINWGGYSMVEATLHAFREILSHGHYDFINLMSGSDYPLTSADRFVQFLAQHSNRTFLEFEEEGGIWWQEAQNRLKQYHLADFRFKGNQKIERLLNQILPRRSIPLSMKIVGRSQWLVLCRGHILYILDFIKRNPLVSRFFKLTWGSDEVIFQTILFNSIYRNEMVNDNLRYIDWGERQARPKTLTTEDLPVLKTSGKFFARKFDTDIDRGILDRLDEWILS